MQIIEPTVDFHEDASLPGKLIIEQKQEIPADFIASLKQQKMASTEQRSGALMHFASIPTAFHELWMARDGYDCTKEPYRETLKKLHAEGLDAFIVTNKRI